MARLNQIIAVEKGVKNQTERIETDLYHAIQKEPLFSGLTRTYRPINDEDTDVPPGESNSPQFNAETILSQLVESLTRRIDVVATKETANTTARADIKIGTQTLAAQVPVPVLIGLEKEVEKLAAFVSKLPQLDPSVTWTFDNNRGVYVSPPVETHRTKKIPRNHVLYEATKEHPAQVQMFTEDKIIGYWTKIDFSGALPAERIAAIKLRLDTLRTAVKFAREEANSVEVTDVHIGANILTYVFEGGDTPKVSG